MFLRELTEFWLVHNRTPVQDHASAVIQCEESFVPAQRLGHLTRGFILVEIQDLSLPPILWRTVCCGFCTMARIPRSFRTCAGVDVKSRPELDCDTAPSIVFNLVFGGPCSMLPAVFRLVTLLPAVVAVPIESRT